MVRIEKNEIAISKIDMKLLLLWIIHVKGRVLYSPYLVRLLACCCISPAHRIILLLRQILKKLVVVIAIIIKWNATPIS